MTQFVIPTLGIILINITERFAKIKDYTSFLILLIVMIVINGGNNLNPDFQNYAVTYELGADDLEPGYRFLVDIGNTMGLDYSSFRLILTVISMTFFAIGLNRMVHSNNRTIILLLYSMAPFLYDVVQFRNYLMICFLVYGCSYVYRDNFAGYIYGTIWILVGAQMQVLGYLYILIVPMIIYFRQRKRQLLLIAIILFGITFWANYFHGISFLSNVINIVGSHGFNKVISYDVLSSNRVDSGWLVLINLIIGIMILWINKNRQFELNNRGLLNLVNNLYILGILMMPFYIMETSFQRGIRSIYIFILILVFEFITDSNVRLINRTFISIGAISLCVIVYAAQARFLLGSAINVVSINYSGWLYNNWILYLLN